MTLLLFCFCCRKIILNATEDIPLEYKTCLQLNISQCDVSERSGSFIVTVYNPLNRILNEYVRLPVTAKAFLVQTGESEVIETQLVRIPEAVLNIKGRTSLADTELVFRAENIPALGFKSFFVTAEATPPGFLKPSFPDFRGKVELKFDNKSGLLTEISNGASLPLQQSLRYYQGSHHWTGAYIFRPASDETFPPGAEIETNLLNSGPLVTEYEQIFSSWASQIVRTYRNEAYVEFEWLVGPIPVK